MADMRKVHKLLGDIVVEDKTDVFSNKHVMTNKELLAQVWGYAATAAPLYLP